jgi:hypothetical protein
MTKDFGGLFTIEQPGSNHIVVPPPEPGSASVSTRMAPANTLPTHPSAYSTDAVIPELYATMRYIDSKAPTVATVKERNDVSHGMASMGISS